jgi:metal-responsive CopG/Arc/MetJ family transcriptional regulator
MPKARVSVTVDRVLLRRCDRVARGATRSQVFEQALARWLRDVRQRSLEEEIERYYAASSPADRAEDAEWATLASRVLGETWA